MEQFIEVFIHSVNFGSTVLDFCVLFPRSEVEYLLQGIDELVEVWIGHVTSSKDIINVEAH